MITRKDIYNTFGWRTQRHLIVIESDDWGVQRIPSKEIYQSLLDNGIRVDKDPYCKYDNLATKEDLSKLFEVLTSVKDAKGNTAIITANTAVCNPDFRKIANSNFQKYYYEPFTETLQRQPSHQGAFELWEEGINSKIFFPQFHGREHVNVKKWLQHLQIQDSITRKVFDYGVYGLTSNVDSSLDEFHTCAFYSGLENDIATYKKIIADGLNIFEQIFGYRSLSFIAPTYTWHPDIEPTLIKCGVKYIQGTFCQKIPLDDIPTLKYSWRGFQGTKTRNGLVRLFRNCFFEPTIKPDSDVVNECMHHIDIAFRHHKAANICSHRLNFIGSLNHENTDRTLPLLKQLLHNIIATWPDAEFITSHQLGDIIVNSKQHLISI